MIRRDPRYPTMTPNQLLGEILHQELVDQDVEKSLTLKMNKSLALNASSSEVVEAKPKTSKTKKEDTSDEGSTNEETAFVIRKYKKLLKSKASRKGDERKQKSQRKCYECGECGHFIVECPKNKNKNEDEKNTRRKTRSTRTSTKGVLTWVNNGTQVMKMRNQRSKAWQQSPLHKSHLHHAPSTTSSTMRTTPTFASWPGGARYKKLPPHLLQPPLHPHLIVT
jgi:rubrerythrin